MAATFSVLDYCLFAAVLLISAIVGLYYFLKEKFGKKELTSDDLLMGGREMSVFPVAMSLVASYMSAITVLGELYYQPELNITTKRKLSIALKLH